MILMRVRGSVLVLEAHLVADQVRDAGLAELAGDELRHRYGGDAARLGHADQPCPAR